MITPATHSKHCCFVSCLVYMNGFYFLFILFFFILCSIDFWVSIFFVFIIFLFLGGFAFFLIFLVLLFFLSDFVADAGAAACCRWLLRYCYLCRTVHRIFNYYISSLLLKNRAIIQNRGYDS